jgi:uncharacterized membrane protein
MSTHAEQPSLERRHWLEASPWAFLLILALAVLLRAWKLTEWSMWEDEEGTVFFSQQLEMPFARFFPIFFYALHGLYEVTGVSVAAGRIFSAALGVLGIVLLYGLFQRFITRRVALVAALLLAVNLGQLFWSQSIRYYNLVVVFELLSMYWFLVGFEQGKVMALLLSNVAFVLALLTHFSAVLLAPVYIGYLGLLAIRRWLGREGYSLRNCLAFGIGLAIILAFFAWQLRRAQEMLRDEAAAIASARDPVHVLITVLAYFSPPLLGLGLLSPLVPPRQVSPRVFWFFLAAGVIPVLEVLVLTCLNTINVTYYYALFALFAFAVLAAFTLVGLYERGYRRSTALLGVGVGVYSVVFLAVYYTTMYGDRPRWKEAATYLREAAHIQVGARSNPEVISTLPTVMAYYLGVDPAQTKMDPLVQMIPQAPPAQAPLGQQWYVVEAGHVTPAYEAWLSSHCTLVTRFEARTGPRDRTLRIYHYQP